MSTVNDTPPAGHVPANRAAAPLAGQTTCCVVGAGPAGAVLALLLARRGVSVTLLELQGSFDRDFGGDTLHPSVMEMMDELGLAGRLLELPHSKLRNLSFTTAEGSGVSVDFGGLKTKYPYVTMLPLSRFLKFVTDEARRYPNFQLIMEADVRGLIEEGGAVRGVRYEGGDGRMRELRALLTVGADGRSPRLRRRDGMELLLTASPVDVLWFLLPRRESDGAGLSGRIGRGRLLILLDRGEEWQAGYVIPKGDYQRLRAAGLEELREGVRELAPRLADRVGRLQEWKQVTTLSVESGCLGRWYRPGLLLIGDAARGMSPVGGVGINYAISDAVAAAHILAGPLKAGSFTAHDLQAVERSRHWPARLVRSFQSFIRRSVVGQALDTARPFTTAPLVRAHVLRRLVAQFIALGVWPVQAES